MKTILTITASAILLMIFLVPSEVQPRPAHKPSQNKIVHAKVKDGTLISGNVSYTFGDNNGGSFRNDPRWQKAQDK